MSTIRLTMAQAVARFLTAQKTEIDGTSLPLFGGVWAIFGHGNVAGMGEALHGVRDRLPTYRAHNEQGMAHAAIAFAKASRRRRMMACTTSIGPGATNMVTAAAVAHVNRLPVLLLPGDVFASRRPDPVLQQIESFSDGTVSANDCFRPVSRYFDRITRPEQIIPALQRAMTVLTDPAECGPVTLALCQDTQTEAYDYPESFFADKIWTPRRIRPDETELAEAADLVRNAKKPFIVAGGGVLYSNAERVLADFAQKHGLFIGETQAGKSSIPHDHPASLGAIGVTGTGAANALAEEADVVIAVGTRLQDFTTGSWALFKNPKRRIVGLNVQAFDATKHNAVPLVADARVGLEELSQALGGWKAPEVWTTKARDEKARWFESAARYTDPTNAELPSDAQVIGAVQRTSSPTDVVVCAAGGLPGELHKHWKASTALGYHMEYGYSCMGYEIAGGLGVKMADPSREVIVMVGDGSYLMMNSELATSVMLGQKLTVVLLDNRGYGCINRLQRATGGESFNNLLQHTNHVTLPELDFAAHAASLGAQTIKVKGIGELEDALRQARQAERSTVIVIDTDPLASTDAGGYWWDVAVPEVSVRDQVKTARKNYEDALGAQRVGD
ncbi:3D-(3,5/4)-trihydroxycyclohexane-1,2-dione acylhydrolase (decyclizing) [Microvirga tunisiensis]|uniref:3D-(3,5/4)-trihydroxycyclohexane-1,2-dione acylhydrolase (Decyclizing) n=1 Tax=Microvirga tunisiensis TaxID=2108360 RepID=A0A5N7MLM9_9HYPH|nr:3D-(3,5/4)-trihydroxycyclohexane-1,2-dione acylhydrolase (decyclizing) [Microvirga tunisiensis]MPR09778.1 3D-(3,5/4)-trihydroxycyclohexane-1,2-dione acylhydrolase (decyclizing) [Microvirga tunisiensis]MPR27972.1 3D-(3,5/4)-trihydroxycyclohexane-1,2-dione acylhydrolase (decyclizing) [Microvirga tunisiensis]